LGSRRSALVAAMLAIAMMAVFAGLTLGLPGAGVTSTTLVTANLDETVHFNSDRVRIQTKDATDVRVQRLDFTPGGFSGWHHHPGIIIVAVQSGAVTLWMADCSSTTYGPGFPDGSVFVEGGDHPVQATSATGATVYVTYVAPSADPPVFRTEDDLPADHCD
jgi:quercetin dioxygenase-like cupin family protein